MTSKPLLVTAPPAARMRTVPKRRALKAIGRTAVKLDDGPFVGGWLRMGTGDGYHTLPFTVNGQSGHYANGTWEPTP